MSLPTGRNPKSYDDIVRSTVLDPDSSQRPTRQQEREAREGFRAVDAGEQALHARVIAALAASGVDTSRVAVEISDDLVRLDGEVADSAALRVLEDTVAQVAGVATIHNQVVVGSKR
jgi:osmotically-inducible protein OsmY